MRLVAVTIAAAALVLGACETDSGRQCAGYGRWLRLWRRRVPSVYVVRYVHPRRWVRLVLRLRRNRDVRVQPRRVRDPCLQLDVEPCRLSCPRRRGSRASERRGVSGTTAGDAEIADGALPAPDAAHTGEGGAGETDGESDLAVADAGSVPGEASIPDREPPPQVEVP